MGAFDYRQQISCRLIRQKRKTLALSVDTEGNVIVKAPVGMAAGVIREFVESREEWIKKQRENAQRLSRYRKCYVEGEAFLYLGETCYLTIKEDAAAREAQVIRKEGKHLIVTGPGDTLQIQKAVINWYKKSAEQVIAGRLALYQPLIGRPYGRVSIKDTKSQWGSLSARGNLSFNYRIVMAPLEIVDYLVVHELCHLLYMDHSPLFWSNVGRILTDYQGRRRWLRKNGGMLTLDLKGCEFPVTFCESGIVSESCRVGSESAGWKPFPIIG